MSQIKSLKSPKNSENKKALESPFLYKELILKSPQVYTWDQYIKSLNLNREQIIDLGYLPLIEYYFTDKDVYYQDLTTSPNDISLEIVKFLTGQKIRHSPAMIEIRKKSKSEFDLDYSLILSFIKRPDILEYLYTSQLLPLNFYSNGISQIISEIIKETQFESLQIIWKYLPKICDVDWNSEINFYDLGKDSNFKIYKFILSSIKIDDEYLKDELYKGVNDSGIDQKLKMNYRF
jgi:hypothetical protein